MVHSKLAIQGEWLSWASLALFDSAGGIAAVPPWWGGAMVADLLGERIFNV
jgi:hypothetical protein